MTVVFINAHEKTLSGSRGMGLHNGWVAQSSSRHEGSNRRTLCVERLEPRELMAIDAFNAPSGEIPEETLITNGSFELDTVDGRWGAFAAITGWNVSPTGGAGNVKAELQKDGLNGWKASHGNQWLELDGDETGPGVRWDRATQGRS